MAFTNREHSRRVPSDQRVESDATSVAAAPGLAAAGPNPPRSTPADRRPSTATTLNDTVTTALALLGDLSDPHDAVRDGRLEVWLGNAIRTAEAHASQDGGDGVARALPAVRTASAHLAAGGLEDTYLALLSARDLLRSH